MKLEVIYSLVLPVETIVNRRCSEDATERDRELNSLQDLTDGTSGSGAWVLDRQQDFVHQAAIAWIRGKLLRMGTSNEINIYIQYHRNGNALSGYLRVDL